MGRYATQGFVGWFLIGSCDKIGGDGPQDTEINFKPMNSFAKGGRKARRNEVQEIIKPIHTREARMRQVLELLRDCRFHLGMHVAGVEHRDAAR